MGILVRKYGHKQALTGVGKVAIVGFIVALSAAIIDTIWAVYLDTFLNSVALVGFFSAGLTIISFLSYFVSIPLIERIKKSSIYFVSLILMATTYILFAINTKLYFFGILAFIITILHTLRTTSFGILVKEESSKKKLSRSEGLMYTFLNIAWVVGPLIGGYVSELFGINIVFVLSAIFLVIASFVFKISKIRKSNVQIKMHTNLISNFKEFFKNKDRINAYILGGGVNLWWSLIYLFMPLYILRNNLSKVWIGYFLFAIAVPLILLEFKFSKISEKIGFKKIFKIGFLIPAIIAISCFFINNIYAILGLLVLASIGLAMLESTTETYFFKMIKDKDENRFYGPYNTTIEVNHLIGKIISSSLLLFLPFKFIFLLFGAFMLIFVGISFKIKDVIKTKK